MARKLRVFAGILLTVMLLLVLVPGTVSAKALKTEFTGTATFAGNLDPGTERVVDHGKYIITGMLEVYEDVTNDPRTSGTTIVESNAVLDMNTFSGTMHGTFQLVNDDGSWDGYFTGKIINGYASIKGIAHGNGGYEGLKGHWEYTGLIMGGTLSISGYILEPRQ